MGRMKELAEIIAEKILVDRSRDDDEEYTKIFAAVVCLPSEGDADYLTEKERNYVNDILQVEEEEILI